MKQSCLNGVPCTSAHLGEKNKNKSKTKLMGLNQLEMRHPQKHQKWVRASGITYLCVRASKHGQGAYCRLNKSSGDPTARPPSSNEAYSTVAKSLNL